MTNFTLTEALIWLWDCEDPVEAREALDHVRELVIRAELRHIPNPFAC